MSSIDNLYEQEHLVTMINQRLEQEGMVPEEMDAELMKFIIELYENDLEEIDPEKLSKFSLAEILHYLQASHKFYLTKKLPEIEQSMVHIVSKYSNTHLLETTLTNFFNDYKNKLVAHIKMEEKEFFPYIKKLIKASKNELTIDEIKTFLENQAIDDFNDNHDPIEDELKEVTTIIHKYQINDNTPLPYKVFLNQVEIFELEMRKHALIEDHILVPLARQLEQNLRNNLVLN